MGHCLQASARKASCVRFRCTRNLESYQFKQKSDGGDSLCFWEFMDRLTSDVGPIYIYTHFIYMYICKVPSSIAHRFGHPGLGFLSKARYVAWGYAVRSFAFSGSAMRPSCDAETAVSGIILQHEKRVLPETYSEFLCEDSSICSME